MLTAQPASASIHHLEPSDWQNNRSFSPAVVTSGGKIVWLSGQTTLTDLEGNDISGRFEEQVHTIFRLLDRTLQRAGGSLANMVTMTVFVNDARHGDRFVQIRREFFREGRFPCSALLTISNFSRPGVVVEIQGVAVL